MSDKLLIYFFLVVSLTCFGQKDSFPEINFKIEINSREQNIFKLRDSQKNDSVTVAEINSDSLSYYLKKFENFKLVDLWLISPKTKKLENDLEKQKDEMLILDFWCPKLKEFSNDYFIGFESLRRLDLYVNLKKFPSEL